MLINAHLDWKHTVYYTAEESHTNLLHPKASGIHLFVFSLWLFPSFLCCVKHLSHQCVSPLSEVERNPHRTQSRSSTLPNKPGRDSLADSCSRWHYYSALSQSSGPGSSTGRGAGPFALPAHQYQHQHMAVLYNTVSAGWYVSVIIQQVLFLSFYFCGGFNRRSRTTSLFCSVYVHRRNALKMTECCVESKRWENLDALSSLGMKTAWSLYLKSTKLV